MNGRKFTLILILLVLASSVASAGEKKKAAPSKSQSCWDKAVAQPDLDDCAAQEDAAAEKEMNSALQKVLAASKDDPEGAKAVQASQTAWLQFKEAQLAALYPHRDEGRDYYGSIFPMCYAQSEAQLFRERAKQLKSMMTEAGGC